MNQPLLAESAAPPVPVPMACAVRAHDWAATPLGPRESWPAALKIVVDLVLRSHFPKCICWGPELTAIYNDAFVPILGNKAPCLGRSFREIWAEEWDQIGPICDRALAGQSTFIRNFALETVRSGAPERGYFTFCYSPVADEQGVIHGFMDTVIETTGEVVAEKRMRILNGELRHRLKNSYAMVAAIVRQTFRRAPSGEAALAAVLGRIQSLDAAQTALLDDIEGTVEVGALLDRVLAPFRRGTGRFVLSGEAVDLEPAQVFSLGLAVGELATNALKYGALSTDAGSVAIEWSRRDGIFEFRWTESGGPPVTPPTRRGFGSDLIEVALADTFGARARLSYPPEGLRFVLSAAAV